MTGEPLLSLPCGGHVDVRVPVIHITADFARKRIKGQPILYNPLGVNITAE